MSDSNTETTGSIAADLRAKVESVAQFKGTIVSFVYEPAIAYPNDETYARLAPITHVAVSNGEKWGVAAAGGESQFVVRVYDNDTFVKFLATPAVTSAVVLVEGEAFKP